MSLCDCIKQQLTLLIIISSKITYLSAHICSAMTHGRRCNIYFNAYCAYGQFSQVAGFARSYLVQRGYSDKTQKMAEIDYKKAGSIYDFTVKDIKGNEVNLDKYRGHPLIVVNIASKCGLTATNNKELTELKEQFHDSKGLRILAFPCNQFANQEPGDGEEIVCQLLNAKTEFGDVYEKCQVNGDDALPLWKYLKHKQPGSLGSFIKWNYTKFIIDKDGQPVERHGPKTDPSSMIKNLEKYW